MTAGGRGVFPILPRLAMPPALASNAFLASLGVKHAIGAQNAVRRGAVVEDSAEHDFGGVAPPPDIETQLVEFERRRGVNHMQIFLERLIAEILETQTATRGLEHLLQVRKLLDECVRNLQELVMKKSGRDSRGLMQLRSKFLMLSMADREARLPLQRRVDKNKVASRVPGAATGATSVSPGRRSGISPLPGSVTESQSLPSIGPLTPSGAGETEAAPSASNAAAAAQDESEWKELFEEADAEAKEAKRLAKRLRAKLAKAEHEAVRSEGVMKVTQKELSASKKVRSCSSNANYSTHNCSHVWS